MSAPWVHVEAPLEPGTHVLSSDESRHVTSRRLRTGDALVAFDGAGHTGRARLVGRARRGAEIQIEEIAFTARPQAGFELCSAIPKGDRLSTMLQMLGQLGVATWQPLVLEDSAVRTLDVAVARWQRILLETCKLARRPWPLQLRAPTSLADAIGERAGRAMAFGDRDGASPTNGFAPVTFFVGPEAGFREPERADLLRAGAQAVSLSEWNLRIETAAVAAAACFSGALRRS